MQINLLRRLVLGVVLIGLISLGIWAAFKFSQRRVVSARVRHLYTLDVACASFSPDGDFIVGTWNIYDAATGTIRVQNGSGTIVRANFSPDGQLVSFFGIGTTDFTGGVFSTETGERRLDFWGEFTPDGKLLIAYHTVVEVATGKAVLKTEGDFRYPQNNFLVVKGDGVYDLTTLERLYTIGPGEVDLGGAEGQASLLAVAGDAVYELATGKRLFDIGEGEFVYFRDEEGLVIVEGDAIYDLATGERLLDNFDVPNFNYSLSSDGRWLAIEHDGVYDLTTGERSFAFEGESSGLFSPDSKHLISDGDVYEVGTWQRQFSLSEVSLQGMNFNEAGNLMVIPSSGVYDLNTGEQLLHLSGEQSAAGFSHHDQWVIVYGDGVYEIASGKKLFDAGEHMWRHSPDGTELIVPGSGVYDVETGERRYPLGPVNADIQVASSGAFSIPFSADGSLLWVPGDGVYDHTHGKRLLNAREIWNVLFSPDSRLMAVMDSQESCEVYQISPP